MDEKHFEGPLGHERVGQCIAGFDAAAWQTYRVGIRTCGCSTLAGLLRLSPYETPRTEIAKVKFGWQRPVERWQEDRMRIGSLLERALRAKVADVTGRNVYAYPYTVHHPHLPAMHDHADGVVGDRLRVGLEMKITGYKAADLARYIDRSGDWDGIRGSGLYAYWVQCQGHMAVHGTDRWYLAVVVGDGDALHLALNFYEKADLDVRGFYLWEVARDEAFIAQAERAVKRYWHWYIDPGEHYLPEATDPVKDLEPLRAQWPAELREEERPELAEELTEALTLKAAADDAVAAHDAAAAALLEKLGGYGVFTVPLGGKPHKIHHKLKANGGLYVRGV